MNVIWEIGNIFILFYLVLALRHIITRNILYIGHCVHIFFIWGPEKLWSDLDNYWIREEVTIFENSYCNNVIGSRFIKCKIKESD